MTDGKISVDRKRLFDFVIRKEIPFESIEQEMADRLEEDEFNSDIAEKALDLACGLYPERPGVDIDETIDKRHTFVSEFMEYCREEVTKKWASNLGMFTREEAQNNVETQRKICKEYWINKFKKMSAYQFSAWKLGATADDEDSAKLYEAIEDDVFYYEKYPDKQETYPAREDVPADLWGKPIPKKDK